MGWGLGAGVMGLEGNSGRVKWVLNPHEFVCLGPGLKGFTPIPCAYKNQIYTTSAFLLQVNAIKQTIYIYIYIYIYTRMYPH